MANIKRCDIDNYNYTGAWNTGEENTGDRNSGDRNSGNLNKTNLSNGCFNTESSKIFLFNKLSDWTYQDWLTSKAKAILNFIPSNTLEWISSNKMTDKEKQNILNIG